MLRIGIDTGGTFTDFVIHDSKKNTLTTFKLPSTPNNPTETILNGLSRISNLQDFEIIHGTTVATNALLERKGAKTALLTTKGFKDILQIGRQNRPELYNLQVTLPEPLVPSTLRFEVTERVNAHGEIQVPLEIDELNGIIQACSTQGVESIAVCLLFSFLNPSHEQLIGDYLKDTPFHLSLSTDILPVFREWERTSTTVANAYVSPIIAKYLNNLENALPQNCLRIMQSNGGIFSPTDARKQGVRCILSGPAGGVMGSQYLARWIGVNKFITFDMGGTSTDVSLYHGELQKTSESTINGIPISVPLLDIHTIGAGGGSIAYLDPGGALHVGPQSTGADPGPACYGKGSLSTVTDANLCLGRLSSEFFLGGQIPLDRSNALKAISSLSRQCNLSWQETALAITEIANTHMEHALRVISLERGYDPRDFLLISFGGAGGLHASDLAGRLGINTVMISPFAATQSALGLLIADTVIERSQTIMLPGSTPEHILREHMVNHERQIRNQLDSQFGSNAHLIFEYTLDMRYKGQSYEIPIPYSTDFLNQFHSAHLQYYGYTQDAASVEIVTLHSRGILPVVQPTLAPAPMQSPDPSSAFLRMCDIILSKNGSPGAYSVPAYLGEKLHPGNLLSGPLLIFRSDTTILLLPGDTAKVDPMGNILIYKNQ